MKKTFIALVALFASMATGIAFAADATGKWVGELSGPNGNAMALAVTLKQDGTKITGTSEGPGGAIEIKDGKIEGDKITFYITFEGGGGAMKLNHTGTITGDELVLNIAMEGGPGGAFPPIKLTRAK
jgi:hypothetical protein